MYHEAVTNREEEPRGKSRQEDKADAVVSFLMWDISRLTQFQGDSVEKDGAGPHPSQRLAMVQKELALDLLITSTGALKYLQDLLSIKQF